MLNNPLNATDPSGYFVFTLMATMALATGGITSTLAIGMIVGGAAFMDAATSGAGLKGAFKAGLIAGLSAAAFSAVGNEFAQASGENIASVGAKTAKEAASLSKDLLRFGKNALTRSQIAGQIAAHAAIGGVTSLLQGGKFGHGFVSAGLTKGVTGNFSYDTSTTFAVLGRTAIAAIVGGTTSAISGGKFANGAGTAAMGHLLNAEGPEAARARAQKERIDLLDHEGVNGAHTIEKHVGKSDNYLLRRMDRASVSLRIAPGVSVDRYPSSMSTFTSLEAANALVNMTLDVNSQKIQAWLNSGDSKKLSVGAVFNGPSTGRVAYREGRVSLNTGPTRVRFGGGNAVTVVVRRNDSFTNGYNVHTAYPRID